MDWKSGAAKGWIRSYKALTNLGVFAVAGTIIGFWYSIGDRAADRHQNAWQVVRDAISWSDRGGTGNLGQVNAIETLTRDCGKPWLLRTLLGQNKSQIVTAPTVVKMICGIAYHRIS